MTYCEHTLQVAWLNYGGVVLGAAGSGNTIPAFQQVQSIKEGSTASTSPEVTPAYKVMCTYTRMYTVVHSTSSQQ